MDNYTINELHVEINHYPADEYSGNQYAIRWIGIYPVDSAIQRLNNRDLIFFSCPAIQFYPKCFVWLTSNVSNFIRDFYYKTKYVCIYLNLKQTVGPETFSHA